MTRQLVPTANCDRCGNAASVEVDSAIVTVRLPGEKPVTYSGENCDECGPKLAQAISDLLGEFLRLEGPVRSATSVTASSGSGRQWTLEELTCPRPECRGLPPKPTRSALGAHLKQAHDSTFAQEGMSQTGRQPRAARVRDQQGLTPEADRKCPLCTTVSASRGGLSTHLRGHHDTGIRALKKQGLM